MATTYEAIATVTVGSGGAASMAFSSIPGTYTDLVVKASVRDVSSTTTPGLKMVINGDTASNYSYRLLYGTGSSAASLSGTIGYTYNGAVNTTLETASTFASSEIYIPNYAGSNKKSLSTDGATENNATGVITALVANLWDSTSAITSLTLSSVGGNFAQYSSATLYGIKNS